MSVVLWARHSRRHFALAALALVLPISAIAGEHHGIDPATIDRSVQPSADFFQFANGKWLDKAKIPADLTGVGAFQELADRNQAISRQVAEKAARDTSLAPDSPAGKVGAFYRLGMDTALADRLGVTPLAVELKSIDAIQTREDLFAEIAHLQRQGIAVGFNAGVRQDAKNSTLQIMQLGQGGLGMPERDYYLRTDAKSQELRKQYQSYIARLLTISGSVTGKASTPAEIAALSGTHSGPAAPDNLMAPDAVAANILALETRLAKASMTRVETRDPNSTYHKTTLPEFEATTPDIPWGRYFVALGASDPGPLNIGQPAFFKEWAALLRDNRMADFRMYLRFHLLRATAPYLSHSFVDADFAYNQAFTGQKQIAPRWKRVLRETDRSLGEALGQLYVARAFSPEAKQRALTLVQSLKGALHDRLLTLDWMSDATKTQAVRKLDAIRIKVGYPDKWRDYTGLTVAQDSYAQNVLRANEFEFQRRLNKLGKPVDHDEWGMTPPTVNAYYSPTMNEIVFPAGILQPPFFDPKADDASNYGGIGVVIGHEMTHGFDDQGRQFDAEGNLKDWWTPEDAQRFLQRSTALANQYSGYVAIDDLHVNGKLTLGENIADLGGATIAYVALEKTLEGKPRPVLMDGFTPEQRFFLSFAQVWRQKLTPERVRLLAQTDPHSPGHWRVIGTITNAPGFVEAWGGGSAGASPIRIW